MACIVLGQNGTWGSYRHLPLPALNIKPVRHAWANQSIRGDLNSLTWYEGPIRDDYENDNLIDVVYSPINFK